MPRSEIDKKVAGIAADNQSGAAELVAQATEILQLLDFDEAVTNDHKIQDNIRTLGRRLIEAQPRMAPIFSLVNGLLLQINERPGNESVTAFIDKYCQKFLADMRQNEETLHRKAAGVLPENTTVLTHSASSTVRETVFAAVKAGKNPRLICAESRAVYEGVEQSRKFARAGIPVSLITNAAMAHSLDNADIILVGADALMADSFVNKIGTSMLALAARSASINLYVLCTSHKFLPPEAVLPPQKQCNPDEILREPPPGITPVNVYFEETPLRHCTAVITENGLIKPAKLRQKLQRLQIDPSFLNP